MCNLASITNPPVDPEVQGADLEEDVADINAPGPAGVNQPAAQKNERYRVRRHLTDEYFAGLL